MAVFHKGEEKKTKTVEVIEDLVEEYDDDADSSKYGPDPGKTISEDDEVNIVRFYDHAEHFGHEYKSYLDLLANLFPNAFALKIAADTGDFSGINTSLESELDADKLDVLLDLDHFVKGYRNGEWDDSSITEADKEKIWQLYQAAMAFYTEDTIDNAIPDYGDTKIDEENGSDQYARPSSTYLQEEGRDKFVISGMDARYSDMRYVDQNGGSSETEKDGAEGNPFKVEGAKTLQTLNQLARILAIALDENNDYWIGTDDAILILQLYAKAMIDNNYSGHDYAQYVQTIPDTVGNFDKYEESQGVIVHRETGSIVQGSAETDGDNYYVSAKTDNTWIRFYTDADSHTIPINISADDNVHYLDIWFHSKAQYSVHTHVELNHKLQFLAKVIDNSDNIVATDDSLSVNFKTETLKIGEKVYTYNQILKKMLDHFMAGTKAGKSEYATAIYRMLNKYGLQNSTGAMPIEGSNDYPNAMDIFAKVLIGSDPVVFYKKDRWQDYYKEATYKDETMSKEGWNESINDLYHFMKEYFDNHGLNPEIFKTPAAWLEALKNANAKGTAQFNYLDPIPLINFFNKIYTEERTDEIKMNVHNMDYTNEGEIPADGIAPGSGVGTINGQTYNYGEMIAYVVNLLMPQYRRRVEVEDLNKNFWVISQCLGILLNQIFGDDGLEAILKGHMAEIMELWNNVKYLWNVIEAQGKMINDLAIALAESQKEDIEVEMPEYYRDVFQYKTASYINSGVLDDKYHWTGSMWDFNGDGYVNGYEITSILSTYAHYLNNTNIYIPASETNGWGAVTIKPGSIEGFKNLFDFNYNSNHSTREFTFHWPFNIKTKAKWRVNTTEKAVKYGIGGPQTEVTNEFFDPRNTGNSGNVALNNNNNWINRLCTLQCIDGDKGAGKINILNYNINDYDNQQNSAILGEMCSGLMRLCFVNVDNLLGATESGVNDFMVPHPQDNTRTLKFNFTQSQKLRPILRGATLNDEIYWKEWNTNPTQISTMLNQGTGVADFLLDAIVFQDFSGIHQNINTVSSQQGFWTGAPNQKHFYNKFLCYLDNVYDSSTHQTYTGLYMLCAVAASKFNFTSPNDPKITVEDSNNTYSTTYNVSSSSNTFFGLYPVEVDGLLDNDDQFINGQFSSLKLMEKTNGTVTVSGNTHTLTNCVLKTINNDTDYNIGRNLRRQVATNMLRKISILASLKATEGYMKTLKSSDASNLWTAIGSRGTLYLGITVDEIFKYALDNSVQVSETQIQIDGKSRSEILAGIVDGNQTTLEKVVAINQQFEISERPLRIWSTDGKTISRVDTDVSVQYTREEDGVSLTITNDSYVKYGSEKVLDSYQEDATKEETAYWGGMSNSLNKWFPDYQIGQTFVPNKWSYANFVCETAIAEKMYQLNTYDDPVTTEISDDSYYIVLIDQNNNEYTTSDPAVSADNFTITFDVPSGNVIKVKG